MHNQPFMHNELAPGDRAAHRARSFRCAHNRGGRRVCIGRGQRSRRPPGTVFVANFGGGGSTGVQATGSVTSYHSGGKAMPRRCKQLQRRSTLLRGSLLTGRETCGSPIPIPTRCLSTRRAGCPERDPVPAVTLSSTSSGSLSGPGGLTFDHAGNLWVANTSVSTVVEYAKSQLNKSGSPTPKVTISNNSFNAPYGVAVDLPATCGSQITLSRAAPRSTSTRSQTWPSRPPLRD